MVVGVVVVADRQQYIGVDVFVRKQQTTHGCCSIRYTDVVQKKGILFVVQHEDMVFVQQQDIGAAQHQDIVLVYTQVTVLVKIPDLAIFQMTTCNTMRYDTIQLQ